jgi:putative transposon-encoded protein
METLKDLMSEIRTFENEVSEYAKAVDERTKNIKNGALIVRIKNGRYQERYVTRIGHSGYFCVTKSGKKTDFMIKDEVVMYVNPIEL